ncbi:MAG TPA: PilZ domain-containing protein, partial [Blastocatellia bacterium]|nr:PilZ domain-containing protein [Blastocatellia bacterium]
VRRVVPLNEGVRAVGVEFIGEHPPPGYLDKPWAVCRTKQWLGINRRRHPRYDVNIGATVEFLTDDKQLVGREPGRIENVSRGGARIRARAVPPQFDLVRVIVPSCNFESLSVLTNRYISGDGGSHVCVQFIEKEWPI